MKQFLENLKLIKNKLKSWAKEYNARSNVELKDLEKEIHNLINLDDVGSLSEVNLEVFHSFECI